MTVWIGSPPFTYGACYVRVLYVIGERRGVSWLLTAIKDEICHGTYPRGLGSPF